jgi:hypothetical protein
MKTTIRSRLALTAVAASIAGFAPKAIVADGASPASIVGETVGAGPHCRSRPAGNDA